jgi:hypothetical protein
MIKKNLYRYFGRNGMITSLVLLDNIEHLLMYRLIASEGKILTNGELKVKSIDVFIEDLEKWSEIDEVN